MATWTIIERGRDEQSRGQYALLYDGKEIGTDWLIPLMEIVESDGQDDDIVIEQSEDGSETARYTVVYARAREREWQADLAESDQKTERLERYRQAFPAPSPALAAYLEAAETDDLDTRQARWEALTDAERETIRGVAQQIIGQNDAAA